MTGLNVAILSHPDIISEWEARPYQVRALIATLSEPTLLVLPTAAGKSLVEYLFMHEHLVRSNKNRPRALLIAPTNPLVDQHHSNLVKLLDSRIEVVCLTGSTPPARRVSFWAESDIIIATPQVVRNDLEASRISPSDFVAVVFDEAHHAKGSHAMAAAGRLLRLGSELPVCMGATASPGTTSSDITSLCSILGLTNIHARSSQDSELRPYLPELRTREHHVDVPESIRSLAEPLEAWSSALVDRLSHLGYPLKRGLVSVRALNGLQARISQAITLKEGSAFQAAKALADLRRVHLLVGHLTSQGIAASREHLTRSHEREKNGSAALQRFMNDHRIQRLKAALDGSEELHPKMNLVLDLVSQALARGNEQRVIVFVNFRDTANELVERVSSLNHAVAARFVGQSDRAGDRGLSQKEQIAVLDRFRSGEVNVLIATQVGEEGLDVPNADDVIHYEPVGSAIRTIQRRGRTGRHHAGHVHVLVARGTRDEGALRASAAKGRKLVQATEAARMNLRRGVSVESIEHCSLCIEDEEGSTPAVVWVEKMSEASEDETEPSSLRLRPNQQRSLDDWIGGENETTSSLESQMHLHQTEHASPPLSSPSDQSGISVTGSHLHRVEIDHREQSSTIVSLLKQEDVLVDLVDLDVGDYRIGDRVLIERKTHGDFEDSLLDGRLFGQASRLASASPHPLLLVEGTARGQRFVHPHALTGALAVLAIDFGLPVISTSSDHETANFIMVVARREVAYLEDLSELASKKARSALNKHRRLSRDAARSSPDQTPVGFLHFETEIAPGGTMNQLIDEAEAIEAAAGAPLTPLASKTPPSLGLEARARSTHAIAMLSQLPGIGPATAEALLSTFGTLLGVLGASDQTLIEATSLTKVSLEALSALRPE